jgi:hypothetical protein
MHTLLDLHGNIPTFISITSGKVHDVNILDEILPEAGAFYVMDRGYLDFERLYVFTLSAAFFVVRTKSNVLIQRRYSHPVDKTTGVRSDHTVILTAINSVKAYPDQLRRVSYLDVKTRKRFKFLTNNFTLPALTIAQIYKSRWQVELFFERSTWCTPYGCHGISRTNCAEWTAGGVAERFRSAHASLDVGAAQYPGCTHTGRRRGQLFQPNQPQNSGRRDAKGGGSFTDRHLASIPALPLTVDRNRMVVAQRADTLRGPTLPVCRSALIPI